jgi:GT2 family glycosyltransferase
MLLFDRRDVINSAGDFYRKNGVPGNRGIWQNDGERFNHDAYVFGACAGAAIYRREVFDSVGLFDEDLFAYCEDVDLSFRAQLAGFRCLFVPGARVYHRLSATGGGPLASYYCGRNFIVVLAKDVPGRIIRRHWHAMLMAQLSFTAHSLWHFREPAARARIRGQIAGLGALPWAIRKRRHVQALKGVSDDYLDSILDS